MHINWFRIVNVTDKVFTQHHIQKLWSYTNCAKTQIRLGLKKAIADEGTRSSHALFYRSQSLNCIATPYLLLTYHLVTNILLFWSFKTIFTEF